MDAVDVDGDDLGLEMDDDRAQWESETAIPNFPDRWADGSKEEAGPSNVSPEKTPSSKPPSASRPISGHKPTSPGKTCSPNAKKGKSADEWQTCPICWKEFNIDNAGLNSHVDYCLSKGTIMEAATEDTVDVGRTTDADEVHLQRGRKKRRQIHRTEASDADTAAVADPEPRVGRNNRGGGSFPDRTQLSVFGKFSSLNH